MKPTFSMPSLAAAALMLAVSPALAQSSASPAAVKAGTLTIEQPWSRATPAGAQVGGGYLRITNTGQEPDRLTGGSAPVASRIEVHQMSMVDNVMRMKAVDGGLEIKPGETVELKPGSYHLMFMDLKEPLKDGETVKGTLVFEKAGSVAVDFAVRGMGQGTGKETGHGAAPAQHKH